MLGTHTWKRGGLFVSSPDIDIHSDEAVEVLGRLVDDATAAYDAHARLAPALPASAAGRDFGHLGAQLADALGRVHSQGLDRAGALRDTAQAAIDQLKAFGSTDDGAGAAFEEQLR